MGLGVAKHLVQQPGVQLGVVLDPQTRDEEAFAYEPDLVLDLSLSDKGRIASAKAPRAAFLGSGGATCSDRIDLSLEAGMPAKLGCPKADVLDVGAVNTP